jgi:hypothetical protein
LRNLEKPWLKRSHPDNTHPEDESLLGCNPAPTGKQSPCTPVSSGMAALLGMLDPEEDTAILQNICNYFKTTLSD